MPVKTQTIVNQPELTEIRQHTGVDPPELTETRNKL